MPRNVSTRAPPFSSVSTNGSPEAKLAWIFAHSMSMTLALKPTAASVATT